MTGFLVAFIATLLLGAGARDQLLIAGLAARQGQRPAVLAIALVSAALAALAALWLASSFAPQLEAPVRRMLAILALAFAALEMILLRPGAVPIEPTNSLGAFGVVVLSLQIFDAARFLLFGIVVASMVPGAAGLGGALGGMAVVAIGWAAGQSLLDLPLQRLRRWLGATLLLVVGGLLMFYR
jgi:hypothetical protein